jgi:hypothetical protein
MRPEHWFLLFLLIISIASCISSEEDKKERERVNRVRTEMKEERKPFTVLEIEEGKIYCIWSGSAGFSPSSPSCVFVPRREK